MTTMLPRRFVIAAPPNGMGWLIEALNRAYRCPGDEPAVFERLIGALTAR